MQGGMIEKKDRGKAKYKSKGKPDYMYFRSDGSFIEV